MDRNYYLVWVVLFCFYSCSHPPVEKGTHVFKIDNIEKKEFDWSSMAKIKKVIPLEMTDKSLLSLAQKCLVKNNRILFFDYKMKALYVFDMNGRFLYDINSLGGGAEEYTELKDANFNYDGSQIVVLDYASLLIYDAADGHFVKRINLNVSLSPDFYRFVNIDKEVYYFFSAVGDFTLYRYAGNHFEGVRERKSYQLIHERFHCQGLNSCLLAPDYGFFNIDEITKSRVTPKYYIDFGDEAIPESMLPQYSHQFEKVDKERYFKSIVEVKETNTRIYIQAVGPDNSYCDIYINKTDGRIITGLPDRKTGIAITDADSSSFYALVYPDYFTVKSGFYDQLKNDIQEEGNPVLLELCVELK